MSFHTVVLTGHAGSDADLRYTAGGQTVANFSVAANRQYTNAKGEVVKETLWFRISAFGKLAEVCGQYLHKGALVLVEGHLQGDPKTGGPRTWTRQDGTPGSSFELIAQSVRLLGGRGEPAEAGGAPPESARPADIPF